MADIHSFPALVETSKNERFASVLELLCDFTVRARAGEFQSVTIVATSVDGRASPTAWSTANGDLLTLIGHLAMLQHDLMDEGRGA